MQYARLGSTDLQVSKVALGTWVFGGSNWSGADKTDCENTVSAALDAGINFIDTAPAYGWGLAETIAGTAVRNRRARVILATKCGLKNSNSRPEICLKPDFIREDAERSLMQLGTDYIDLFQIHWPDPKTPIAESMGELARLKQEGKIRHIGVCNFDAIQLAQAVECAPVASVQNQFSFLKREEAESVFAICRKAGISFLGYGTLGGGILSDKYRTAPEFAKTDARRFFYRHFSPNNGIFDRSASAAHGMSELAARQNATAAQCAISWVLAHDAVTSALCGARNPQQVRENAAAADLAIPLDAYAGIKY
ncbi:MAG: aldo/keto reductase [Elusimicrobiaceae bacterium]|nr:aldo/keto reductase [Elusimicrobiaceae bacterium]